jgi:hypothetical protein
MFQAVPRWLAADAQPYPTRSNTTVGILRLVFRS